MNTPPISIEVTDVASTVRIAGKVIARGVTYEQFLAADYGQAHVEWVNGVVIEMPSISERHDALVIFLRTLLNTFLELFLGGRTLGDPMLMRLPVVPSSRAPDIQVLLEDRLHQLHDNEVVGPANLVIEVVSPGNRRTDEIDKRREYELGGVDEYWILDFERSRVTFLQLAASGVYEEALPDAAGIFHSRVLPGLRLPVTLLWRDPLPTVVETVDVVRGMRS